MTFEVTYDVPPPSCRGGGRYPFRTMEVGGSFIVADKGARDRAVSAAINYTKTVHGSGKKFSSGMHGEGYRIWRVR